MTYIWAREGWPRLRFDLQGVQAVLYRYAAEANALQGSVAQLDDEEQTEALIDLMVSEAITTSAIEAKRKRYYETLAVASRGGLDVTQWVGYFVETVLEAQIAARATVAFVLEKARFWRRFGDRVNERQRRVLERMFRAGPEGFEGGISARKYVGITGTSKATASRDLADLLRAGALRRLPGGGRSTRYELALGGEAILGPWSPRG